MTRRIILALGVALSGICCASAQPIPSTPGSPVANKIAMAYAGAVSASVAVPRAVAAEHGLFARHGLEVRLIQEPTGAIIGRQTEFGYLGSAGVLLAIAQYGTDLRILGAFSTGRISSQLVAKAEIKTPEQFRGKRFGVITLGAGVWVTTVLALQHLGLDPQRDQIAILAVGSGTEIAKALRDGTIDAALLTPAQSQQMKAQGFSILLDLYTQDVYGPQGLLVTTAEYLRRQPDVVERLASALIEAAAFSLAPQNKAAVLRTIMTEYHLTDPAAAERGYVDLNNINRKPYPSLDKLKNLQKVMALHEPRVLALKVDELVDDRFVRKLDESGTIDRLYASYEAK